MGNGTSVKDTLGYYIQKNELLVDCGLCQNKGLQVKKGNVWEKYSGQDIKEIRGKLLEENKRDDDGCWLYNKSGNDYRLNTPITIGERAANTQKIKITLPEGQD